MVVPKKEINRSKQPSQSMLLFSNIKVEAPVEEARSHSCTAIIELLPSIEHILSKAVKNSEPQKCTFIDACHMGPLGTCFRANYERSKLLVHCIRDVNMHQN